MLQFVLTELSTAIGEVDAIMSLARVAVEYDFVRPKVFCLYSCAASHAQYSLCFNFV